MVPPPPPPPPVSETQVVPTEPLIGTAASPMGSPKATASNGGTSSVGDHNDQLMAAIRNGVSLKPAKTNDRSTPGFIKQANGVLHNNGDPVSPGACDKSASMDEMKDALQAELRNTLKRKIKMQDLEQGDCRKNDEIERSIESSRSEVQLKVNDQSVASNKDVSQVENPLKTIVDIVDKERSVIVAPTKPPSQSPSHSVVSPSPSFTVNQPLANGVSTLRKVSTSQNPIENGNTIVINFNNTAGNNPSPVTVSPKGLAVANGVDKRPPVSSGHATPASTGKSISSGSNGSSATGGVPSFISKVKASQNASSVKEATTTIGVGVSNSTKMSNGNSVTSTVPIANGTSNNFPKLSTASRSVHEPGKLSNGMYYSNTLPRAKPTTYLPTTVVPAAYTSTVKVSIGSYGAAVKTAADTSGSVVRNGKPSSFEPLTIDTSPNGAGSSTNSTASPTTPKELLSPQVRNGAASIRPSQIRTLTKAGSVVSHTDILETSKPTPKLPVTLVEPAPVLTAAAAVSPPPKTPANVAPLSSTNTSPKERTGLFEKVNKEPPKSPLNRWADSSSISGGTARKLLLTHGRPNFTIKRSVSRQGFDVDVSDSKSDTIKPVFRILTDLERMEQEQEQQQQGNRRPSQVAVSDNQQQQQYVSFAKDLANAPNNHPDMVVVTKTIPNSETSLDPFLTNLKDIKIDIDEMKVVNTKES
ncbi:mucin-12-like [Anopheles nili]|uniref:mucin-12-like n=1 Tax=Anopheles nili TaxID=185578 RepID=UPI00237AAE43|nr:mucin-12-like [Anopheles nili]